MGQYFHLDPVTLIVVVLGFVATYAGLQKDSKWHSAWILKHDKECDENRRANATILTAIQTTNSHLVTLTEAHGERLERIEKQMDRR